MFLNCTKRFATEQIRTVKESLSTNFCLGIFFWKRQGITYILLTFSLLTFIIAGKKTVKSGDKSKVSIKFIFLTSHTVIADRTVHCFILFYVKKNTASILRSDGIVKKYRTQWLTSLTRRSLLLSREFDPHRVQHLNDEKKQGFVNRTSGGDFTCTLVRD